MTLSGIAERSTGEASAPLDRAFAADAFSEGGAEAGGMEDAAGPGTWRLVGPYERLRCVPDAGGAGIRIDRARVEVVAARLPGRAAPAWIRALHDPIELPPVVGALLDAMTSLPRAGDRVGRDLEDVVIELLLLPLGDFAPEPRRGAVSASARLVARAQSYMDANLANPPSLTAVAAHCGVSVRSLQTAFRRELDLTPSAWLRGERLDRVRRALERRNAREQTVTEIASGYGFLNMGDFAAHFRARFGVTPSSVARCP